MNLQDKNFDYDKLNNDNKDSKIKIRLECQDLAH